MTCKVMDLACCGWCDMPLYGERGQGGGDAAAEGCEPTFRSHEASKHNLYEKEEDEMFLHQRGLTFYMPRQ